MRSSPGAIKGINDAMEHLSITSELYCHEHEKR